MNVALATIWRRNLPELSKSGTPHRWLGEQGLIASVCLSENLLISQQWGKEKGVQSASCSGWRSGRLGRLNQSCSERKPWW